jgi:hypothetical protein
LGALEKDGEGEFTGGAADGAVECRCGREEKAAALNRAGLDRR